MLDKDNFTAKTNLTVSSTEFCQSTFDEGDVGMGKGGGMRHTAAIIPSIDLVRGKLIPNNPSHRATCNCSMLSKYTQQPVQRW
jgi:hypothetical protein